MILYMNDTDKSFNLARFYGLCVKKGDGDNYIELWEQAGGKVIENEDFIFVDKSKIPFGWQLVNQDIVEILNEKQAEIDQARDMIELQQESLRVKNKRIEELETTLRVLKNINYEQRHGKK